MTFLRRLQRVVFPGPASVFLFWVTLLALVVRLVWNLAIHPPGNFITSDMHSYWTQSSGMLNAPLQKSGTAIFFPYGTASLLTVVRAIFGQENHLALAIVYACLGTLLVPLVYYLTARLTHAQHLPRIAALVTCFYYPFVSYGGYYLSELPFGVCVTATAFYSLRLADRGRTRDAYLVGAAIAIGATFRPQLLASIPLLLGAWLFRRRVWRGFRAAHWLRLGLPIAFVVAFSMARFHYHTGRWGLISGNGALNYAFGRCHALTIEARAPRYLASFSPPPMGYLGNREKRHPNSFVRLDPALQTKISLQGTMWTPETFADLTRKCVEATGYARQIRYALMHVIMLWGFNNAWPDSMGGTYLYVMLVAVVLHNLFFLVPTIVMFGAIFRREFSRHALLGVHLVALVAVAMLYFGDVRYRMPYDGLIIVLGLDGWRRIHGWLASGQWHLWGWGERRPEAPNVKPAYDVCCAK